MATAKEQEKWIKRRLKITDAINKHGNTITITPVSQDITTDDFGRIIKTEDASFQVSAVSYDNSSINLNFNYELPINQGEMNLITLYDTVVNKDDKIEYNSITYKVKSITPIDVADITIANIIELGVM